LLSAIQAAGYTTPTPIQQQAIPVVLAGRDLLGLAQTGTGKTAAFVLPMLQTLSKGPSGRIRALILAPTRELAEQIHQAIRVLGKDSRLRSMTIYGGVSKGMQIKELRRGADIVVACPGRLLDHLNERNINLSQIEMLVLDEADRMCDMGFLPDVKRILAILPKHKQTLFFSATMPEDIRGLADNLLQNPTKVQIGMISPAKTVTHALYPVSQDFKFKLLLKLLETKATGRVLIFTRTKHRARNMSVDLNKRGYRVAQLQGNMSQNQRLLAMNGFRSGKFDLLVATDIAARGIDVSDISHVINYDMPDTVDAYIHRIGRTGRAEQVGEAFTLAVGDDEAMVRDIEKALKEKLERRRLEDFDYGNPALENQAKPQAGSSRPGSSRPSSSRTGTGQSRPNNPRRSQSGRPQNGPSQGGSSQSGPSQGGRSGRPQEERPRKFSKGPRRPSQPASGESGSSGPARGGQRGGQPRRSSQGRKSFSR
jgi:ATP-dependent RNA helicase RhlE